MEKIRRKMGRFLNLISLEDALERVSSAGWTPLKSEIIPTAHALGRIAFSGVMAVTDFPQWNRSLVDGFAVKAQDCRKASETNPLVLPVNGVVEAGKSRFDGYKIGACTEIYTGGVVPLDYDAVIMAEDCYIGDGTIKITSAPKSWANIEKAGDDIRKGDSILPASTRIKPWHITAIVSAGVDTIEVYEKIKVGVISTGNELFSGAEGKIQNTTQNLIINFLNSGFVEADFAGMAHDDAGEIRGLVTSALEKYHCVVVTGGTSLGGKDEVPEAITDISNVVFGGAMIRPGRTMTLYESRGKPVFSISGVPVPSMLSFDLFFEEYLKSMTGLKEYHRSVTGKLSSNVTNKAGYAGIYRVKLVPGEHGLTVEVIRTHGTGSISSILDSDGIILIPGTVEGLEAGQLVEVKLFGDRF
ncbi:MAG: molybdopterin molybdotransferase MoeA [Candidatus Thermoplasmatota archaeon]|nr:molybdopterin molybdotransferase MoeA [Candidatus Thermoplasmatota archaeon]